MVNRDVLPKKKSRFRGVRIKKQEGGRYMYTSVFWLALMGTSPSTIPEAALTWNAEYRVARQQAAHDQKPLVVLLGSGPLGWHKVGQGGLSLKVQKLLLEKYNCVYVDTSTKSGQRLKTDFEMPGGLGLVISDKTGKLQAFRHEGKLSNATLMAYLRKFSDPTRVVTETETNPAPVTSTITPATLTTYPSVSPTLRSTSYYQGTISPSYGQAYNPGYAQPNYFSPGFSSPGFSSPGFSSPGFSSAGFCPT